MPVGGEQRERQPVGVDALHVREPRQRVGVEREHRSGEESCDAIARPGRRPARVPAHAVSAKPAISTRLKTSTGEPPSQRAARPSAPGRSAARRTPACRAPDRRCWPRTAVRGARQLVRHPRQDPLVQLRVAVVVARQRAGRGRQRPGMDDGQQHADGEESATIGCGAGSSARLDYVIPTAPLPGEAESLAGRAASGSCHAIFVLEAPHVRNPCSPRAHSASRRRARLGCLRGRADRVELAVASISPPSPSTTARSGALARGMVDITINQLDQRRRSRPAA